MTKHRRARAPDRLDLYELSVQDPEEACSLSALFFADIYGKQAHSLREDFCGTFLNSWHWVRRDPKNTALALDIDPQALAYGRERHLSRLSPQERRRLRALKKDVIGVTRPPVDIVMAGNFSFNTFHEWDTLVTYFKCARASLKQKGIIKLELAGGPGFTSRGKERRTLKHPTFGKFKYIWDQRRYDPLTHKGLYAIHFDLLNGRTLKNAFVYDWRIWTVPELRLALHQAGFSKTYVYWDKMLRTGEEVYVRSETGRNDYSWISYVVGAK